MLKPDASPLKPFLLILFLTMMLASGPGCSQNEEAAQSPSGQEDTQPPSVVAQVGSVTISVDDFKSYLEKRPTAYRHQVPLEELQKRRDKMVLEEVLFQEALRLDIDQHPDVRRRYRTMLTQKLMDEQVNRRQWDRDVPEAELQAYYDQHIEKFNRPAQVRIADIFISIPETATKEQRAALEKKADQALSHARALKGQRAGFNRLVRQYSSPHAIYGKNTTGFFDIEGKPRGIDRELAEAAFKLERVGSISDQVIATPEGLHVIMLVGKRAAVNRSLGSVRNQITRLVQRHSAEKAREDYIKALKAKADIKVDQAVLATVQTELVQNRSGKPESAVRPAAAPKPEPAPSPKK